MIKLLETRFTVWVALSVLVTTIGTVQSDQTLLLRGRDEPGRDRGVAAAQGGLTRISAN